MTKIKRNEKIMLAVCAGVLSVVMIFLGITQRNVDAEAISTLVTRILKVGKADAIVITEDDHAMLIDAGEEDDGQEISDYITNLGIKSIDTMIITHFDKDHVGGADTVLENIPVTEVIIPDYEGTGSDYTEFVLALEQSVKDNDTIVTKLTKDMNFDFRGAEILVEPPSSYEIPEGVVEMDNNFSLITTITHGENTMIFMGDAEKQLTREWLKKKADRDCDFLKIPHHGVFNLALNELFAATKPTCAAICTSDKNPADNKVLEYLKTYRTQVFETRNGDITITSDGSKLKVSQSTI